MPNIRINSLPSDPSPSAADVVPIDGATTRNTTLTALVDAGRPLASQAEAEAGVEATKSMTPLTTAQAIAAQGGAAFATAAQGATADAALPAIEVAGGTTGQVLAKASVADFDFVFTNAGAGDVLAVNNLSDLANLDTARTNLGAQAASPNLTTLAGIVSGSVGQRVLAETAEANLNADGSIADQKLASGNRVYNRAFDQRSVKDYGAPGTAGNDSTPGIQATWDAVKVDSLGQSEIFLPVGRFETVQVNVDAIGGAADNRFSIHGVGQGSFLVATAQVPIFKLEGTGSYSMTLQGLRAGTTTPGNNVDQSLVSTTALQTCLDFQYSNLYINGLAKGFRGSFVSGIITNVLFDFMEDGGYYGVNKDNRKLEFVADHFYATKDVGIQILGAFTASGGATTQTHRDDAIGAGHLTVTGCGFDRPYDATVQQKFIDFDFMDNLALAGNWYNGKTPGVIDTGTHDAIEFTNINNASIAAQTAYYMDRGYYLEGCSDLALMGLTIRKGNLLAAATAAGAVTMINCARIIGALVIEESGGVGLVLQNVNDSNLKVIVQGSGYSGVYMNNCKRTKVEVHVQDANQLDSADINNSSGIILTGGVGTECEDCEVTIFGSLTSAAQGQRNHVVTGSNTLRTKIVNGNLGAARTGFTKFTDNSPAGANRTKFINVGGVVTRNGGEASIVNPATNIVVNHGLDRTPEAYEIEANLRADAAGVTRFWIDTVGATSFRINVNATPTPGPATFAWRATTT